MGCFTSIEVHDLNNIDEDILVGGEDLDEAFDPLEPEESLKIPLDKCVVMVDPISTGLILAKRLEKFGMDQILVWSDIIEDDIKAFIPPGIEPIKYLATLDGNKLSFDEVIKRIKSVGKDVHAVYIGSEPGVEYGEKIATELNLPGNDGAKSYMRRNKYFQQEATKNAGLNHVHQMCAKSMDDVEVFLKDNDWNPFVAVVKPSAGSATVGVVKCNSKDEVRKAVKDSLGTKNVFSVEQNDVLLQEFLQGNEYVVNSVSIDGKHKIISSWEYDKRNYKGYEFIYHGCRLLDPVEEIGIKVRKYALQVLDAIELKNGCCHMEIIYTTRGPVLVETNCRLHGGEGAACAVAEMCIDYSQMTIYADAFLDPSRFNQIPDVYEIKTYGILLYMRNPQSGIICSINKEVQKEIRQMKSYRGELMCNKPGDQVQQTVDMITRPGTIYLVNENLEQLKADFARCNELNDSFFHFTTE